MQDSTRNYVNSLVKERSDKADSFLSPVKSLQTQLANSNNQTQINTLRKQIEDLNHKNKHRQNLFDGLISNAKDFVNYDGLHPSLSLEHSGFSDSPTTSFVFKKYFGFLNNLANKDFRHKIDVTPFETKTVTSCLAKSVKDGKGTYEFCNEPHCIGCKDCEVHQQELKRTLDRLTDDSPGADEHRSLHLLDLAHILDSWGKHEYGQGNDMDTYDQKKYNIDAKTHHAVAEDFSNITRQLRTAFNQDYFNSNGAGGAPYAK